MNAEFLRQALETLMNAGDVGLLVDSEEFKALLYIALLEAETRGYTLWIRFEWATTPADFVIVSLSNEDGP